MPVAVKKLPDKEYITNLIPAELIPVPKPPRYISKYRPQVKVEEKRNQQIAKTMGPAKVEIPDTKNFLRKNSRLRPDSSLPEEKTGGREDATRAVRSSCEEANRRQRYKQLSDEEREELLCGLKKNWEAVHHDFQGLSVVIDTIRKKQLKEKLEMLMKQLEQDISLIQKHKRIYLANGPDEYLY
eukprot:XP_014784592.1 PREDICTED: LOW QUALITY PROTEIN: enkurin-like [Octopus bimaculoides]